MTDPGASAGNQQPGVAEPALPDSAVNPRTEEAANPPHDPADASSQPISEEVPTCGSASGTEASASRFEIVPTFQTGQLLWAARNTFTALRIPSRKRGPRAGERPARPAQGQHPRLRPPRSTRAAGHLQDGHPPDLGLLKINLPAVSVAASLVQPGIARHILPAACDLGFHKAISTMVNSWDHGLLGINQQLAKSAAALVAPHQDLIRSMADLASIRAAAVGSLADFAAMSATRGLVDLFRSWRETAETGLGLLRALARAAYRAALRARAGVLDGDDGPVAWFIEAWLHMRVTPKRIEAVSAALLEEGWDAESPKTLPACSLTCGAGPLGRPAS